MDNNRPLTRPDLEESLTGLRAEIRTDLALLEEKIEDRLLIAMRGIETSLLTAFHSYAQSNAARLNLVDITDRELRIRMDALENRVLNLETRRPPAA